MISKHYKHGYIDEFGRAHVVTSTEKGWMTTSYDILIQIHKIRKNKTESILHPDHPYVGLSYKEENGRIMTVKEVVQHFGFGDYWAVVAEDEGKDGNAWILQEFGSSVYEKKVSVHPEWEDQLKDQVRRLK